MRQVRLFLRQLESLYALLHSWAVILRGNYEIYDAIWDAIWDEISEPDVRLSGYPP
jgi:hypothetical protein